MNPTAKRILLWSVVILLGVSWIVFGFGFRQGLHEPWKTILAFGVGVLAALLYFFLSKIIPTSNPNGSNHAP